MDLGILWLANSTIPTLPMMRINSDALSMSTKMCYGLQKGSIWHNREMQPATAFSPHTKAPGRLSSKKVSKLTLYRLDSKTLLSYSLALVHRAASIDFSQARQPYHRCCFHCRVLFLKIQAKQLSYLSWRLWVLGLGRDSVKCRFVYPNSPQTSLNQLSKAGNRH